MLRRRPPRAVAFATILAVSSAAFGPGCSLMFVDGPPRETSRLYGHATCTQSPGWPIFDGIAAGWFLLNLLINATKPSEAFGQDGDSIKTGAIMMGVATTALFVSSAGVGFSRVSDCKRYLDDGTGWTPPPSPRRQAAPPPAPAPAAPPAYPPAPGSMPAPSFGAPPEGPGGVSGVAPAAGPGAIPAPGTVAPPAAPVAPPVRQMKDEEAPRSGPRPRSQRLLPATVPMLAAMPKLRSGGEDSGGPRFTGVSRFPHPWDFAAELQ